MILILPAPLAAMTLHSSGCHGALALELAPGTAAARRWLERAAAGELAAAVARDLAGLHPGLPELDLALSAALYDPVELLRPGWPLHRQLQELLARAPGNGGARVLGLGADPRGLPAPLAPETAHARGPLRLLPWTLAGEAEALRTAGERLEATLLESGMAPAATALLAQEAFGLQVEHARYLTLHDLAAMMAMQYEHAGLAPLWRLIEAALLRPGEECWLDQAPEPLIRIADAQARIGLFDPESWQAAGLAVAEPDDPVVLERGFERFLMRQRQCAAVLEAHGIAVTFDHCPAGADPRGVLRA